MIVFWCLVTQDFMRIQWANICVYRSKTCKWVPEHRKVDTLLGHCPESILSDTVSAPGYRSCRQVSSLH